MVAQLWTPKVGFTLTMLFLFAKGLSVILWRFLFTGRPIFGAPRDNATFLHEATEDFRGKPVEKLSGPIWKRLAWRWAVVGVPLTLLTMHVAARARYSIVALSETPPPWTEVPWLNLAMTWWALLFLAGVAWFTREGIRWVTTRKVTNEFVYPAWAAVCSSLGVPYRDREARRNVVLPEGFEPQSEVDEPGGHSRLARWTGLARLRDWQAMNRLRQARAIAEATETAELVRPEPSDITPPEPLEVPPWPQVPAANVRAADLASVTVLEPPVTIYLPPGKAAAVKTQGSLLLAVGAVLGMPEPKATWYLKGRRPYVELRPNRPPPPAVTFAQIKAKFEGTDMDHPVIGLAAGNRVVTIDYLNNSPHVLISGGSGTGKSVLLKSLHAQRMHWGAALVVLDYKRVSHRWAHNLPGCIYAWRIDQLHEVACRAGEELERRIETVLPEGEDTEAELVVFRTVDILVEEINSLTPQLAVYWAETRGPNDPARSPAIAAINRIVNMGREYSMHVHIGAQRASANVFGANGGDIRESFQTRLMAKWTIQTWKMLAGSAPYQRCPNAGRGIWARVQDDEVEIVRTPFLTNAEAREWAISGVPSAGTVLGGDLQGPPPVVTPVEPDRVTLKEALDRLPGPVMTLKAIRLAADRHRDFPASIGTNLYGAREYDLAALTTWKADRDERVGGITLAEPRRPGIVYAADVVEPDTGEVVCGYVGQTVRGLAQREAEHMADKPWADLVEGRFYVIQKLDSCTARELDEAERHEIATRKPLYNYREQEGADHAIPKWTQKEQRHARDRAAGRPLWVPVDLFNGEVPRHPLSDQGVYTSLEVPQDVYTGGQA